MAGAAAAVLRWRRGGRSKWGGGAAGAGPPGSAFSWRLGLACVGRGPAGGPSEVLWAFRPRECLLVGAAWHLLGR